MAHSIRHQFQIQATNLQVFEALNTIEGLQSWWTEQAVGTTEPKGMIHFAFGDDFSFVMQVLKIKGVRKIVWKCTEGDTGWEGHELVFQMDEMEGQTKFNFSHIGWESKDDYYAQCNFIWGRYLESLKQYCETGKGHPFVV
jgi:uncharacterized protein YndB with AHSA1/START domain